MLTEDNEVLLVEEYPVIFGVVDVVMDSGRLVDESLLVVEVCSIDKELDDDVITAGVGKNSELLVESTVTVASPKLLTKSS